MKNKATYLVLSGLLLLSQSSVADIWAEREALANIEIELTSLEKLITSAKQRSNSQDRTTFDYQNLLIDIRKIRSGISHHLTVPMEPVIPSGIDALSANYTEHKR
jgi:RAQPRD family integrative conjugative element protein